jgi:hypothetical protein
MQSFCRRVTTMIKPLTDSTTATAVGQPYSDAAGARAGLGLIKKAAMSPSTHTCLGGLREKK